MTGIDTIRTPRPRRWYSHIIDAIGDPHDFKGKIELMATLEKLRKMIEENQAKLDQELAETVKRVAKPIVVPEESLTSLHSVIDYLSQQNDDDRELISEWNHEAARRFWLRRDIITMLQKVETL